MASKISNLIIESPPSNWNSLEDENEKLPKTSLENLFQADYFANNSI